MHQTKFRVGVLMGGMSIEHEVSFNSGRTICDHLDTTLYDVVPLYQRRDGRIYTLPWRFLHRGKTSDFIDRLDNEDIADVSWDQLPSLVDFVYIAVHGRYAEDGALQGMLEVLGLPYLGAKIFSSALTMNKNLQKKALAAHGISVPRGIVLSAKDVCAVIENSSNTTDIMQRMSKQDVSFPCVVKPVAEGSSLGVRVAQGEADLRDAILYAALCDPTRVQEVMIEEKLTGMEFVSIALEQIGESGELSWRCLPPTEVEIESGTDIFDYEQKYMPGRARKITPARCSATQLEAIQNVSVRAAQILDGSTIFRIDGFVTPEGDVVLLDGQPITGMSPATFLFHQAAEIGMSHTDLINQLIETELRKHNMFRAIVRDARQRGDMDQQERMRVVVLLGGDSPEREISLESGRNITYKLSPHKYDVTTLFVDERMRLYKLDQRLLVQNSTQDIVYHLSDDRRVWWSDLPTMCDFVFIGLHGGRGENGAVQGALDMLRMPYNGSGVFASSLCMDKYKTAQFLTERGFVAPVSQLVTQHDWDIRRADVLGRLENSFSFPLIIKPHNDGCSVGVRKASCHNDMIKHLDEFFAQNHEVALVEELIGGMELTVGVLGNDTPCALPPSHPVASEDVLSIEEKFLPGAGENQTPAPLDEAATQLVQRTVEEVYTAIGCRGYARIDCFYQTADQSPTKQERVVILEINTLPGLTPATCIFHQAAEIGMKPMEFIERIVELGVEEHGAHVQHSKKMSSTAQQKDTPAQRA